MSLTFDIGSQSSFVFAQPFYSENFRFPPWLICDYVTCQLGCNDLYKVILGQGNAYIYLGWLTFQLSSF